MVYLVAAYAVLWAISFGLVFSMVWRQRRLESELRTLAALVDDSEMAAALRPPRPEAASPTGAGLPSAQAQGTLDTGTLQEG